MGSKRWAKAADGKKWDREAVQTLSLIFNSFHQAEAYSHRHESGNDHTCDLKTPTMSADGLWMLALDKTEQKGRPPNRAFPRQEVAQISVLDGTLRQAQERIFGSRSQKCVFRTPDNNRLNDDWDKKLNAELDAKHPTRVLRSKTKWELDESFSDHRSLGSVFERYRLLTRDLVLLRKTSRLLRTRSRINLAHQLPIISAGNSGG